MGQEDRTCTESMCTALWSWLGPGSPEEYAEISIRPTNAKIDTTSILAGAMDWRRLVG